MSILFLCLLSLTLSMMERSSIKHWNKKKTFIPLDLYDDQHVSIYCIIFINGFPSDLSFSWNVKHVYSYLPYESSCCQIRDARRLNEYRLFIKLSFPSGLLQNETHCWAMSVTCCTGQEQMIKKSQDNCECNFYWCYPSIRSQIQRRLVPILALNPPVAQRIWPTLILSLIDHEWLCSASTVCKF